MKKRPYDWSKLPNIEIRGKGLWCHARVEMNGTETWRALKIQADPDGLNAPHVLEALRAFKVALAKDSFSILQLTRTRDECSSFAELFAAYRETCKGRDIAERTIERNILDLSLIVRTVHGENFSVDAARLSLCTLDLLIDFRAKRLAEFKARAEKEKFDPEIYARKLHSARVTIKSTIHHARSLFAQEVRQERPYRELVIPNLDEFMKFRPGGDTTRPFEMPDAGVLQKLREGATFFKLTKVQLWFALVLTANFGLRRGSAVHAKWKWIRAREDGTALLHVRLAKGNTSTVGISAAAWADMQRLRLTAGADDFILPGDADGRDAILEELKNWLRQIGFDEARCPVHELRGLFVNKMAAEHSLDDATEGVGHSNQKTTRDSYFARGTDKSVDVV